MKTALGTALAISGGAASAFASGGTAPEGGGLLATIFVGFVVCVIVFQAIPAFLLFVAMIRGLFSPNRKRSAEAVATGKELG